MAVWKLMGVLTSCALAFGTTCGCSLALGAEVPPVDVGQGSGTITVDWTVAGVDDPTMCARFGADEIEVVIYDENGDQVATAHAACGSFDVTVPLPEGTYSADVKLVDQNDNAITTTTTLQALDVIAGTDLAVAVDFPSSSVL
jgi:hypothetical protein